MARIARAVVVNFPHHITQRGNFKQKIVECVEDFLYYLDLLKSRSEIYGMKIWAYCIMENHVHFVAVPMEKDSFARTLHSVQRKYAMYFNAKKNRKGHLWEERFFSCALSDEHLYSAIRYVENNPVRAGLVKEPHHYRWSSAMAHIYKIHEPILSTNCPVLTRIDDWAQYLSQKDDEKTLLIRKSTLTGRPLGDESFVKSVEKLLGRQLRVLPRGRPPSNK
jgi:putative transposase